MLRNCNQLYAWLQACGEFRILETIEYWISVEAEFERRLVCGKLTEEVSKGSILMAEKRMK